CSRGRLRHWYFDFW
nr:immunoglobulin heavy chain junction region [Mus musculus]